MGVHCGLTEDTLDETSYPLYNKYLIQLNVKFKFDALVNLYGNSYAGEIVNEIIEETNPFNNLTNKTTSNNKSKNTLEQLQMMGVDVNIHKNAKFTPIDELIKKQ